MASIEDKIRLVRLHPVAYGLSDQAVRDIAEAAELCQLEVGTSIQRRDELVKDVYLVIHGRLHLQMFDLQGFLITDRLLSAGTQFGTMAAALGEPTPLQCVVNQPATLLKFSFQTHLGLTQHHPDYRMAMARLLAESVRSMMMRQRLPSPPRVLALMHPAAETLTLTHRLLVRLQSLGEAIHLLFNHSLDQRVDGVRYEQIVPGNEGDTQAQILDFAAQSMAHGRLLISVDPESVTETQFENTFAKADQVCWCVTPDTWRQALPRLQSLIRKQPAWRDKICLVWLLTDDDAAPPAAELVAACGRQLLLSFSVPPANRGGVLTNGFERLVHIARGVQIGVALGGGAARGMAHLGVLKALEEQGIVVDMIAGTSAGAMTGTVYASDMEVDYAISRFCADLRPSWLFRAIPKGEQWFLLYKYRTRQFDPMLRKYLRDKRLEQLPLPMHTITVDLVGGKAVVREQGDAVDGILESINLPVLSKPINRAGQSLVDGGLINNIPADVLAAKGCNFIIAVSVTARMELEFARNRPDTPGDQMRPASTIQTLLRSFLVQSHSINSIGVEPADIVIEPDVTGFQLTEFTRTDELAAIGQSATLRAIDAIKIQLQRLDPQLFPGPVSADLPA